MPGGGVGGEESAPGRVEISRVYWERTVPSLSTVGKMYIVPPRTKDPAGTSHICRVEWRYPRIGSMWYMILEDMGF